MREELIVKKVKVIWNKSINNLCTLPYPNHKKGCPNYDTKKGCPPKNKIINEILNLKKSVYLMALSFNLKRHARKMKQKHPNWTEKQCRNLLYWQSGLRKQLKIKVEKFIIEHPNMIYDMLPEAHGVNITKMMINNNIKIEWDRPLHKVWQVALIGEPK